MSSSEVESACWLSVGGGGASLDGGGGASLDGGDDASLDGGGGAFLDGGGGAFLDGGGGAFLDGGGGASLEGVGGASLDRPEVIGELRGFRRSLLCLVGPAGGVPLLLFAYLCVDQLLSGTIVRGSASGPSRLLATFR